MTKQKHLYALTLSSVCIIIGLRWDISWHGTVGRDTFFTPPHVLVYLAAILGGLLSGIQVLYYTLAAPAEKKSGLVKVWGVFYSSLGALFCIWGAIAMLTSAPFDNWWHTAYGLDVVVVSPPHTLLGLGMLSIQLGTCISISKHLNLLEEKPSTNVSLQREKTVLRALFIITAASLLSMISLWVIDYTTSRLQRSALFYEVIVVAILLFLPAFGEQLRMRFGMTMIALAYFFLTAITNWILQMIPGQPMLGPILNPVTHLQPLPFPLLLFVPALAMDLLLQNAKTRSWQKAALMSIAFVLLLFAVQYPLSGFLVQSPGARNWFFGSDTWPYNMPPDWEFRYQFQPGEESPLPDLLQGITLAIVLGFFVSWLSLRWGSWLQQIKR